MTNWYDISDNVEGQFQPGSDDRVLLNKFGIISSEKMDDVELYLLEQLTTAILGEFYTLSGRVRAIDFSFNCSYGLARFDCCWTGDTANQKFFGFWFIL